MGGPRRIISRRLERERARKEVGYGVIEADVLHAYVRRRRPRCIIHIGCGVSTTVTIRAASVAGYRPDIICVAPYPSAFLEAAQRNRRITLLRERTQETPRAALVNLVTGDLLVMDSTHTVKPGNEVNRILLEIFPRLDHGIFLHFHEVVFPYDYQQGLSSHDLFVWTESTLLHASLAS